MAETLDITEPEAGGGAAAGLVAAIVEDGAFKAAVLAILDELILNHPDKQDNASVGTNGDSTAIVYTPNVGVTVADASDVANATAGAFMTGETVEAMRAWPAMDEDTGDYSADFGVNQYVSAEVDGDFNLETCTTPTELIGGQVGMFLTCTSTTPNFTNGDGTQHIINGGLPTLEADSYYFAIGEVVAGPLILWTFNGPFA